MLDLSGTETPEKIRQNLIAFKKQFANAPEVRVHDEGSFWVASSLYEPGVYVLKGQFEQGKFSKDIKNVVWQINSLFEDGWHRSGIRWWIFPEDQKGGLSEALKWEGFTEERTYPWLWLDFTNFEPPTRLNPNLRIERVSNDSQMDQWSRIRFDPGWLLEFSQEPEVEHYRNVYGANGYHSETPTQNYVGYDGDTPVVCASVVGAGGAMAIRTLTTLHDKHKRGYGSTLSFHLLEMIRNRGYADTWIEDVYSSPKFLNMGFVEADFGIREYLLGGRS